MEVNKLQVCWSVLNPFIKRTLLFNGLMQMLQHFYYFLFTLAERVYVRNNS